MAFNGRRNELLVRDLLFSITLNKGKRMSFSLAFTDEDLDFLKQRDFLKSDGDGTSDGLAGKELSSASIFFSSHTKALGSSALSSLVQAFQVLTGRLESRELFVQREYQGFSSAVSKNITLKLVMDLYLRYGLTEDFRNKILFGTFFLGRVDGLHYCSEADVSYGYSTNEMFKIVQL